MPDYTSEIQQPGQRKSAGQTCLASRLVYTNIGQPIFGELIANNEIEHIAFSSDLGDQEKLENSLLGTDNETVETLIRGSICDGSPTFGPAKYGKYRNRRTTSSLEILAMRARADPPFNEATRVLCVKALALGRDDIMNTDKFADWLQLAPYMTNLNLLRGICDFVQGDYSQRKREVLDFVAHLSQAEAQSQQFRARVQEVRNKSVISNKELFENFQRDLFSALPGVSSSTTEDGKFDLESFKKSAPKFYTGRPQPGDQDLHSLAGHSSSIPELERLLDAGTTTTLQAKDAAGRSPLLISCAFGNYAATMLFLKHGADASILSDIGQGVLHFLHYFDEGERVKVATEIVSPPL